MIGRLTVFVVLLVILLSQGCATPARKQEASLEKYLECRLESVARTEKDDLVTTVTDLTCSFHNQHSPNPKAVVSFLVIQKRRDEACTPADRCLNQYTLVLIDGSWKVTESKSITDEQDEWVHRSDFYREMDPMFSELEWIIK